MPKRRPVRALLRVCVAGSIIIAASVCPFIVTVDFDAPVTAPPFAFTLLLASSSALLALVGCVLRQRRGAQ